MRKQRQAKGKYWPEEITQDRKIQMLQREDSA